MLTVTMLCGLLASREGDARLQGVVRDEATGAAIAGARVELPDAGRHTRTDSAGRYVLPNAPSGAQRLRASGPGYGLRAVTVPLPASGDVRVDLELTAVASRLERVRVVGARGATATSEATPDARARAPGARSVGRDAPRAHPMLAEGDHFLALGAAGDVALAAEGPTSLHVRGGAGDQTLVLVDGAPLYSPAHASGSLAALNPDAVELVELHAGVPPPRLGGAASGVAEVHTRVPNGRGLAVHGGLSLTSARVAVEGPLAGTGAAVLVSARRGGPSLFAGRPALARLDAASSDALAKLSAPLAGGAVDVLAVRTTDRAAFAERVTDGDAARGGTGDGPGEPARHRFAWDGATVALAWQRPLGPAARLAARLWRADLDAAVAWRGGADSARWAVDASRSAAAYEVSAAVRHARGELQAGVGVGGERVRYQAGRAPTDAGGPAHGVPAPASGLGVDARRQGAWAHAEQTYQLGRAWHVAGGARVTTARGERARVEPRAFLRYAPNARLAVSAGVARAHQPVQSLRNPESPTRSVFGGDLPAAGPAAGAPPAARSDQVTAAAAFLLEGRWRLAVDGYARRLRGLALVAPATDLPFATTDFAVGRGRSDGVAVQLERSGERVPLVASLGLSRVTLASGALRYAPAHAASATLGLGAAYRPSANTAFRAAFFAAAGRRATALVGPVEWEACNPIEGGCEIAGAPRQALGAIGGARLAPYARLDVGARRAWRVTWGGRPVWLESHVTVSNVLDRRNAWAVIAESPGEPWRPVGMRPLTLLAAGLDWRF